MYTDDQTNSSTVKVDMIILRTRIINKWIHVMRVKLTYFL